jgi:hypothetical protein
VLAIIARGEGLARALEQLLEAVGHSLKDGVQLIDQWGVIIGVIGFLALALVAWVLLLGSRK